MRPGACPALLQAILTVLFQLGEVVLKIYGSTIANSRNAKVLAVQVGGLNGSFCCTKLELHSIVGYVTKHASSFVTKSVVANMVASNFSQIKGYDEIYRSYCATDVL